MTSRTTTQAGTYRYTPSRFPEIYGGADSLAALPDVLSEHGVNRVLVITSGSFIRKPALLERLKGLLAGRVAEVFDEVLPHSPIAQVERAVEIYRACGADGVVSLGGGSAIDTAKGVVWYADEAQRDPPIAHIAIPSTFSGAEYTTDAGITVAAGKRVHRDPRIVPAAVVLDPAIAGTTPLSLRRGSLANALAHCLEGSVSVQASPMTDAFYLHAIYLLDRASLQIDSDAGLSAGQAAAALAALHQVPMGLAHAFAHVIGGRYATPHAATHGVLATPVMRLNLPVVASRQCGIARALGATQVAEDAFGAWESIRRVRALLDRLGIPRSLRDLGIGLGALEIIADLVVNDASYHTNPLPLDGAEGRDLTLQCLQWAWSGELPAP